MADPLTDVLLIIGVVIMIRRKDAFARILGCTFLLNLAGGLFSVSQEGPPYIYRTAAVIIPAFLIAGLGMQWLLEQKGSRWALGLTAIIIVLNLYLYFGLEAKNAAAMRVMAYEPRLIGQEIARDNEPVWLVASDVLTQTEVQPRHGQKYPDANPVVVLPPVVRKLAIINFSGRYDARETFERNLANPKDIFFVAPNDLPTHGPAKVIFKTSDPEMNRAVARPDVAIRYIRNIFGEALFAVASFSPVHGELMLKPRLVFGIARDNGVANHKTGDSHLWLPAFRPAFVPS